MEGVLGRRFPDSALPCVVSLSALGTLLDMLEGFPSLRFPTREAHCN